MIKDILHKLALTADEVGIPSTSADNVLANALEIIYWVVGVVAVIVIIFAGFRYVTSAGDPAVATKAKNMILYSVIGIIIVILAFVITQFILGRF